MNKLKVILYIAVLAAAGYVGFSFAAPYYRFYSLKSDSGEIVRFEHANEAEIKRDITEKARGLGIPLEDFSLSVYKTEAGYGAEASWSETVNIFDQYKKSLEFGFEVGG